MVVIQMAGELAGSIAVAEAGHWGARVDTHQEGVLSQLSLGFLWAYTNTQTHSMCAFTLAFVHMWHIAYRQMAHGRPLNKCDLMDVDC